MVLAKKRVFIVEDNVMNRITYQVVLMNAGAIIEFDRWGRDCVERLQHSRRWDLIILDLMLPGGQSGYQLYEEIHQVAKLYHTPIIAVSAAEPGTAMARCRELGFSGYFTKPINEEQFPHQLVRVIAGEEIWSYS
jgi:CheY-like chemotaxis protein